jgi:mono/diheme cytochrome c family protein
MRIFPNEERQELSLQAAYNALFGNRKKRLWTISIMVCMSLLIAGAGMWWFIWRPGAQPPGEASPGLVQRLDPKEVARGQALYQANCAACHGQKAEGRLFWDIRNPDGSYPPPPHDSTGHTWHHGDGLIYRYIRDGGQSIPSLGVPTNMPAFGDRLSPQDIRAIITYFKSLWKPEHRSFQAEASLNDPFPQEVEEK